MPHDAVLEVSKERLLQTDITVLNEHGVDDSVMMKLAAEHAARVEALCQCCDPTAGRALLITICTALLGVAKRIEDMSIMEPELVNV